MTDDLTGKTLKGYELRQLIGRGGFGAVYRAYQPLIDRDVALKVILPEYANHPNFIRRFETEAQTIAKLENLHIVPLYDYWRDPDSACLVMRWLKGGSLQDSIDQRGHWELSTTARLLDQIAEALTVAHRNGIIHRDLKPANILLDEDGNAYLADFGIAKHLTTEPQTIGDDDRFGSPAYISPEQVVGQPVSPQTDIYSLGVVLYMLLTGRTPFLDPSTTTVIRRQLSESLPPIQSIRPDLPYALNIIIWRATSKQPGDRYPDVLSLAADFRQVITPDMSPGEMTTKLSAPTPRNITVPLGGQTMIVDIPVEPTNPYKGLQAFQEADAPDFFGRQALIDHLIERLHQSSEHFRFLAVVGPSGSGKSSAVRAGLVPTIRRGALDNSQDWFVATMIPGAAPLRELSDAISRIALEPQPDLENNLRVDDHGLGKAVKNLLPEAETELLLVIDQFEEIFTLTQNEAERNHFLKLILNAIEDESSRVRVIVTLRADMYDRPLLYPRFGSLMRERTEIVLPLNTAEMELAIIKPLERIGLQFEPGLVGEIIAEVDEQPGALPLLQYALTELFERREGFMLTRNVYRESGGVLGALARRADELYNEMDSFSQEAVRQMFLRLVTLGEGMEDTRRRVQRAELNAIARDKRIVQEVIDVFSKFRLLTLDYEPGTRTPTVEVAHEALIRVWERLRTWLDAGRNELLLHRRLSSSAAEWTKAGRDPSFLASGSRLAQFEGLTVSTTIALNEDESAYLWASVAARLRSARRLRWFMVGLAAVALIAISLALFAFDRQSAAVAEQQRADAQASLSRSRELAITALTGTDHTDLALLLSLESLKAADTFEARNSLLTSLQLHPHLTAYLNGDTGAVRTVAYSPDGKTLASAGRNGQIILWDAATHQQIGNPLTGHTALINAIAFSPDGKTLVSASSDGTVRLWDVVTQQPMGEPFSKHDDRVWSVAFSPDGKMIASGDEVGTILLWDPTTRELIGNPLTGHTDTVYSLAFSADSKILASGGEDTTVRLWDTTTQQPIGEPLTGHSDWVLSIAFNPNGSIVASTGADNSVIFWNTSTSEKLSTLETGQTNNVRSIAFSPDGRYFATGSLDKTIRLWNARTGDPIGKPFTGHTDGVWSLAFSPDSSTLASGSVDNSVILWDVGANPPLGTLVSTQQDAVLAVAYNPDGTYFATAGGNINSNESDNQIYLWDPNGSPIGTLSGHDRYITALAFSDDGRLASASADRTVRVWNVTASETLQTFRLPIRSDFIALAFSPDGKTLAAGLVDGSIILWDTTTGSTLGQPITANEDGVLALAFSPDGKTLASGGFDSQVILWDVATQTAVGEPLLGHTDAVNTLAYSPDGKILASGSRDTTIMLWDPVTRQPIDQPLVGHTDWVNSLAFNPDSSLLVSASNDKSLALWDIAQGERLGEPLLGHIDWALSVTFSPDGKKLVSGGLGKNIIQWDVDLASWQQRACAIANRNFTQDEWERYFQTTPYRTTCP